MKFVAYYRVSTDKQGREGYGMQAQKTTVAQYIESQNGELLDECTEVESGKRDDRPELDRAIRRCKLTGAVLVIAKLDRLSRDVAFITNLQKTEVSFVCADMPQANTMTINILAVMAQHERELISQRTKAGLQAARERGVTFGNPRLDECRNTDTTAATQTRSAKAAVRNTFLREIVTELEVDAGRPMSLSEVADALNAAGYTTARGKAFSRMQVSRIRRAA